MHVAIAINGVIANVIVADDLGIASDLFPDAQVIDADAAGVGIGWQLDGETWAAPPAPAAVPLVMTHLQFIEHVQVAGEMTDADLVAAKADPGLAAFWIKFELAQSMERDHPTTVQGLAALVATGYLTEAERDAVVELWPTI